MSSEDAVVTVRNLYKCYEIYESPRDRLKQLVIPPALNGFRQTKKALGLSATNSTKKYFKEFWALHDISFEVKKGESFGIIGRNGCGKSTLLQILAGTLTPTAGTVSVTGRIAALLELGSGFNPEFSGKENVFLNARILGLGQKEIEARYDQIVEFADIGEFIDQPVKTYSSGMFVRLAFAVQAHIDASIVIIDEALAVGDVFFRQKCYSRLEQLRNSGAAILLVSHAMTDVEQYCDRSILLDKGRCAFIGSATEATKHYYLTCQPKISNDNMSAPEEKCRMDAGYTSNHQILNTWPSDTLFISVEDRIQITNGMGRCIRYIICDDAGNPCTNFEQGGTAYFYYEFRLDKAISIPLAGVVVQNERGLNVHGKGSLEYEAGTPDCLPSGTLIRCCQSVELRLELGEYTFELGLATVDPETYKSMYMLGHEQLFARIARVCHLTQVGTFSVTYRQKHMGAVMTHHGLVDLPGSFQYEFLNE